MFKQSVTNLLDVSKDNIDIWLNTFDRVLTDCDGVLWDGDKTLEGASNAIYALQDLNKDVFFYSNNTIHTRREICDRLNYRGYDVSPGDIISTAHTVAQYLASLHFGKRAYIIGKVGIAQELTLKNIGNTGVGPDEMDGGLASYIVNRFWQPDPDIGAVIVGFDEHFSYAKMLRAKRFLSDPDCLFIGLNNDKGFGKINDIVPGSSTIIKAIEAASRRSAFIIAKPHPVYVDHVFQSEDERSRTLIIGDSCKQDVLLGYNCQCQTLLVGTGVDKLEFALECKDSEDAEMRKMAPDLYLPQLSDLTNIVGHKEHSHDSSGDSNIELD